MRPRRWRRAPTADAHLRQISAFLGADGCDRPVTSAFEDWCDEHGVHPEALGAWEAFADSSAREDSPARLSDPPAT